MTLKCLISGKSWNVENPDKNYSVCNGWITVVTKKETIFFHESNKTYVIEK